MTVKRSICTTPPGCHNGCGIMVHLDKSGRIREVRGDPSNPFNQGTLCPRGPALPGTVYHPDRQLHPLLRRKSGWKRISWEEALARAGDSFIRARENYGPSSVIFCKGTGRDIGPWLSRLAYSFGSSEYFAFGPGSGSACLMPRMSVTTALFGGFMVADCSQYFQSRYEDPRWQLPECILVWGSNPVDSNPDGFLGKWIVHCMRMGSRLVVVDPRKTWMARRADIHLAINPGTDAALAMGFLNLLFSHGLVDEEFANKWINGHQTVMSQAADFTLKNVSIECGVSEDDILSAALLYGRSSPAALHWGVSVDMSPSAMGTAHALTSLVALSGNLDIPGGNVIVTDPFGIKRRGVPDELASRLQRRKTGLREYPMIGSGIPYAHADVLLDEVERGRIVRCAWYQGTGITANGFAQPGRVAPLLAQTELSVVVDIFMSPAAEELADIFLPVCTCLERRGIRNWWYQLAAFDRVISPLGESRSDVETVLSFGRIVAPEHFPWPTDIQWFDHILEPSGYSWRNLCEKGWLMPGTEYGKHLKSGGFNTPSRKVELQPELMKRSGLLPAPWYIPPPFQEKGGEFGLKLTTGARTPFFFHSEHRNVDVLRKLEYNPAAEIHPEDLTGTEINDGDWILIESPWGSCKRVAHITSGIKAGVVSATHGWLGEELNINSLIGSGLTARGGLGYPFRCVPCRITGPVTAPKGWKKPSCEEKRVENLRPVETHWCTGCRACVTACWWHTGLEGIAVCLVGGEWTPSYTSVCIECPTAPCKSVCHTQCLTGTIEPCNDIRGDRK